MPRQRGLKSAAHLAVIGPGGLVPSIRRPSPPNTLTEAEAAEWKAIVNRMPADWFPRETHPMLVQLCRLTVRSHDIARLINKATVGNAPMDEYQKLLRLEASTTEGIARLCTRMRISQQSTYDKSKHKPRTAKYDPWTGLMGEDEEPEAEQK
jgi:hypothetical protein